MFSPLIRKIVILVAFGMAAFKFYQGDPIGFFYLGAAALLVYYHIRFGSILLAYSAFRRQDFATVRRLIEGTRNPERLRPSSHACYYFLKGILCTLDKKYEEAREHYRTAVEGRLQPEHLKCLAYCALTDTSLELDNKEQAAEYLTQARAFENQKEAQPMIEELEKKLAES